MKDANGDRASASRNGPRTLAIDVGDTGLKASVLDGAGRMLVKRVRVATPYPCQPEILLGAIADLTAPLPPIDRISIGFPGVIRDGRVITAPHFDTEAWHDCPLEEAVSRRFGKPARLLNDAEVQGLGIVAGRGLEVVLTLGTGVGSAVFSNGALAPHLELAQHPIHKGETYIGNEARLAHSAAAKPVEDCALLFPYDQKGRVPAALECRIGQRDARFGLSADDGGDPPVALHEHGRAWEQRGCMPIRPQP